MSPAWTRLIAAGLASSLIAVLLAPMSAASWADLEVVLRDPALRSAAFRTAWTSLSAAVIACGIGVPTAYAISRGRQLRQWIEPLIDVPLAAPPVVVGVCLLLLFRGPLRPFDDFAAISFNWPAVLIAQSVLSTCLATRLLIAVFDGVRRDTEGVARSLGASSSSAFIHAVLPACGPGVAAAGLLAWARAFGEFGPVLVFAAVTRDSTEVLSTSIHLELSAGRVGVAAVLSLAMLLVAAIVSLVVSRSFAAQK